LSETNGARPKMYKVTVNLPEDIYGALTHLSETRGVTKTQVLREAIKTEEFLRNEAREGHKILIEDEDKKYRQILMR
jgi:hypothetical protein